MGGYILAIDQSTQGTKALLFDRKANLIGREDFPHKQMINEYGHVSHNPQELYENTLSAAVTLIEKSGIDKGEIAGIGLSNQRETALVWDRTSGEAAADAIVWQCSRSKDICDRIGAVYDSDEIRKKTGLILSPYFPASKYAWFLENIEGLKERAEHGALCFGTVDTYLIYRLTEGNSYFTDYSNASRTQLFNITDMRWDEELCGLFGLKCEWLAEVYDSDACFGVTDLDGYLDSPVPIHGVLGDSNGALFGQGCLKIGMVKATYGTGTSIMMNVGEEPVLSKHGLVTSLAWRMQGKANYILEGNINYTGAAISWLKDIRLVDSPEETELLAKAACSEDRVYFVPAFSGLGAPYWDSHASALITGMTRTTTRAEIARAGLECIAYQIADVVNAMCEDTGRSIKALRVDGGGSKNGYLMQFQSDILDMGVQVPEAEELSGIGAAYAAGLGLNIYQNDIFDQMNIVEYASVMGRETREKKYQGWKAALNKTLL